MLPIADLSTQEIKLVLRIGRMRAEGVPSKHKGGYRDYEISDNNLTKWDIAKSYEVLKVREFSSHTEKYKYRQDGRRDLVYIMNLTPKGVIVYFEAKSATRRGLDNCDLEYLDKILDSGEADLTDFSSKVLLSYIDFVDINSSTGYNLSSFATHMLNQEEREKAEDLFGVLKESIDKSSRKDLKNSDVELLFTLVNKLEIEIVRPKPRKNILKAHLLILLEVLKFIGVVAGIMSGVIALLRYLGS